MRTFFLHNQEAQVGINITGFRCIISALGVPITKNNNRARVAAPDLCRSKDRPPSLATPNHRCPSLDRRQICRDYLDLLWKQPIPKVLPAIHSSIRWMQKYVSSLRSNVTHALHWIIVGAYLQRQEFLKQTISSLSCNVIEELQKAIKILSNIVDVRPEDDTSQHESALERIKDYVDNIDTANDFYKIGGFSIFGPCLNSPHSCIRWRAADVIAELAQNNPFCQERFLETGLFPVLLNMIDTDPADTAKIKALYAVSCK